nr:peptidylprolyl isomerase [Streptomyces hundungensis]
MVQRTAGPSGAVQSSACSPASGSRRGGRPQSAGTEAFHYDGTIFHRVVRFMIQGGGFTLEMQQKPAPQRVENGVRRSRQQSCGELTGPGGERAVAAREGAHVNGSPGRVLRSRPRPGGQRAAAIVVAGTRGASCPPALPQGNTLSHRAMQLVGRAAGAAGRT